MRRNGVRFALISISKMGHQTLLLRLSAVLRNAVVMCDSLITPGNCWRKTTWPEFQPSLPPGLLGSKSPNRISRTRRHRPLMRRYLYRPHAAHEVTHDVVDTGRRQYKRDYQGYQGGAQGRQTICNM